MSLLSHRSICRCKSIGNWRQLAPSAEGKANLITHHPQPRVPCQAPVNPRFEHVVHALGRWLPVETRAGIEATDKANSLRKAPTHCFPDLLQSQGLAEDSA